MLKVGQKRPDTPNKTSAASEAGEGEAEAEEGGAGAWEGGEWAACVRLVSLAPLPDGVAVPAVGGGSDAGQFPLVADVPHSTADYISSDLNVDDILLEIQGRKVAGYTRRDTVTWLDRCVRSGSPVVLKTVPAELITKDLRLYLNARFRKGSVDHDLQNTIRDNLYLRTVPVTTRAPRDGELEGVDYTFLTAQQFHSLHAAGRLLESGFYRGNHYGTPRPSGEPSGGAAVDGGGAHPSSEGKRRRNRSNVEAMAANDGMSSAGGDGRRGEEEEEEEERERLSRVVGAGPKGSLGLPPDYFDSSNNDPNNDPLLLDLGPLPPKWEKAYTEKGEVYFIDHNSSTSHWLDPRLSKFQKKSLEECGEDELPYGWERIDDPLYGTYYIDHVNRLTQYENPVLQARHAHSHGWRWGGNGEADGGIGEGGGIRPGRAGDGSAGGGAGLGPAKFTLDPLELEGERMMSTLVKSLRGLGFTIVGGDDNKDEFLQIKSVVPNGPAWLEGKLRTGDVLVSVNERCVLGYTHHDMVSVFQSISPGETVRLEVCRGYPLPFDPNDPNTEVVTTVAVNAPDCESGSDAAHLYSDRDQLDMYTKNEAGVGDGLGLGMGEGGGVNEGAEGGDGLPPTTHTIPIVKGALGFGFTIADSAYGQKVKKILDRQRCKNLAEGDILVEINDLCVRDMCHGEVVQVLKDCTRNEEAAVTVQRAAPKDKAPSLLSDGRPKTPLVDPTYYNGYYVKRKESASTSFEHEQPHSDSNSSCGRSAVGVGGGGGRADAVSLVVLHRQETGFGFRIVGGTEEGSQVGATVSIGHIVAGGAADADGRLSTGDEIVSVDGACVVNSSHHHVVQLMGQAAARGQVSLGVRHHRAALPHPHPLRSTPTPVAASAATALHDNLRYPRPAEVGYPYGVTVKRRENEGFGFVIISSLNKAGSTIGRIIEGSPAERCGRLRLGDHIQAVNGADISALHHGDIVNLIKDSGYAVTLTIGPPVPAHGSAHLRQADEEDGHRLGHGSDGGGEEGSDGGGGGGGGELERQYHAVELGRGTRGFGFSIRGGREFQNMALYVLQIADNGPAAADGRLQIGDQIIEINGINTKNMTHAEAIEIIRNGGPVVRLLVRRDGGPPLLPPLPHPHPLPLPLHPLAHPHQY